MTTTNEKARADELHAAIMNIQCIPDDCDIGGINAELAYKQGHRDARYAAAELVAAHRTASTAAALDALIANGQELEAASASPEPASDSTEGAARTPLTEAGIPFEEMERLANKWGDFDPNHGGAFIFSADPASRFNVFSFVQECIDTAIAADGETGGGASHG